MTDLSTAADAATDGPSTAGAAPTDAADETLTVDAATGDADPNGELRVCHAMHHLALGGLENQVLRLIRGSQDLPVSYTVCYFGEDDSLREEFEAAGARVVHLDTVSSTPAGQFDPRSLARVTSFLREESFDVLHAHVSLYVLVVARICARLADTPVVGTYHNTRENYHPAMQALERATRPLSATNIAVSTDVERSYADSARLYAPDADAQGFDRRTYTIHNGIDVDEFATRVDEASPDQVPAAGEAGGGPVFLSIGRYAEEKNQRALIRAMDEVVDALPDAHLFVVGWGPLEDDLRRTAAECGVVDNVTITGRVPSVHEYYALADAFVLPSLTEGLSVVLLESMTAGLPVVGTDVAGTGEAIEDGTTGYVVPPDSASALADAMIRLSSEERRQRMGRNGYERVCEHFSIRSAVRSYQDVYRRLV
ncbi:glycosyltransferase family 4 protein [Halosimplex amylolyticum]|uniref:glycosyltransferase family 4 protein n=1 Tax=Halosimplex amylolyticum TaxID=3396616 RepID=UPI003F57313A